MASNNDHNDQKNKTTWAPTTLMAIKILKKIVWITFRVAVCCSLIFLSFVYMDAIFTYSIAHAKPKLCPYCNALARICKIAAAGLILGTFTANNIFAMGHKFYVTMTINLWAQNVKKPMKSAVAGIRDLAGDYEKEDEQYISERIDLENELEDLDNQLGVKLEEMKKLSQEISDLQEYLDAALAAYNSTKNKNNNTR